MIALLARNRTAFFVVGDMSQEEMEIRLQSRVTVKPFLLDEYDYPTRLWRDRTSFRSAVKAVSCRIHTLSLRNRSAMK